MFFRNTDRLCIITILLTLVALLSVWLLSKHSFPERKPKVIYKWPPSNIDNILSDDKKSYNIAIGLRLTDLPLTKPTSMKRYFLHDLFRLNESKKTTSFEELPYYMSKYGGGLVRYPNIYITYPQDVPMQKLVADIKAGVPVDIAPQYNFPMNILATSKSVCYGGSQHDLVVVVKNALLGFDDRTSFRKHMQNQKARFPSLNVGYVFSVGMPRSSGGRVFNRDGQLSQLMSPAGDQLEAYDGRQAEVMARIYEEIATYDDIVLGDYEDTYYNLSRKSVVNYRWMSAFCGRKNVKLFMTIDDDHRLNLSMIAEFMKRVPDTTRNVSEFGQLALTDGASRIPSWKLYISRREIPWDIMPRYLRGFSHLIGPEVVDDVAIATAYTKYSYIGEDVYLGLVHTRLKTPLVNEPSMFSERMNMALSKSALVAQRSFFNQRGLP